MKNEKEYRINTYDQLKCIWMASQVVEYKLCDNHFDCENCQFDKVMRNLLEAKETQSSDISDIANIISDKLCSIKYDDKIIYLKNNLIAKEICPDTYYIGINPILSSFLDTMSSMTIYEQRKNIIAGQQVIEILGEWGTISLLAPMNFLMYDILYNQTETPFRSQWIAIIGVNNQEIANGKLYPEEWNKMHEKATGIIDEIKSHVSPVGRTMMDGGTQIKFLHQLVGKKRYINILNSLNA